MAEIGRFGKRVATANRLANKRRASLRCSAVSGYRAQVIIMAKVPQIGRVKTRLAADIGGVAATMFYRNAARAVMLRLNSDKRWNTVVAVAPDHGIDTRAWPRSIARIPQGGGDLGARMQRVFDTAPPGPVLIIGTDIPQIQPQDIAKALRQVRACGAVIGPSGDGGYWLIGQSRLPKVLRAFDGVRWSSVDTLSDTVANLAGLKAGLGDTGALGTVGRARHVALSAVLNDVDDGADHLKVRAWAGRVVLPIGI